MAIDLSSDFGVRVGKRLREEGIIWLTTTGADGTPQPNPVWFLWNGETVLIFSVPNQAKLANIGRTPRISLHFNSNEYGGDVAIIVGAAAVDPAGPTDAEIADYSAKYADGIKSIGLTTESFLAKYSVPIRITPDKLRGF